MDNMRIWNLVKDTPQEAQKTIPAGKLKGFTDIKPIWRLRRLTEVFGACGEGWKYEITRKEFVPGANREVMCFLDVNLYYKKPDGSWSEPIPGIGGSMLTDTQKGNLVNNDDGFKNALSDAIGTACKALGMSENIYFGKPDGKYSAPRETPQTKPPVSPAEAANLVLNFGKYSGMTIRDVFNTDKKYLVWLADAEKTEPGVKNAVQMVLGAYNASKQG